MVTEQKTKGDNNMSENYRKKIIDKRIFEANIEDIGDCDFEMTITLKDEKTKSLLLTCTTYCVDIGDAKEKNTKPSFEADGYSLDGYYAFNAIEREQLYQEVAVNINTSGIIMLYIQDLYVEPAFRRQGNAKMLINILAKLTKEFYNMDTIYFSAVVKADKNRPGYTEDLNDIMINFLIKEGFWKKKNGRITVYLKEISED